MVAVYVPTNHLYLGDIVICEREKAQFPDISVEEGIQHLPDRRHCDARGFASLRGNAFQADFRV